MAQHVIERWWQQKWDVHAFNKMCNEVDSSSNLYGTLVPQEQHDPVHQA